MCYKLINALIFSILFQIQASSNGSIPPGNSSAFQPVVTAPSIGGRGKAQNELVLELQHKVMLIEGENKRLNVSVHVHVHVYLVLLLKMHVHVHMYIQCYAQYT